MCQAAGFNLYVSFLLARVGDLQDPGLADNPERPYRSKLEAAGAAYRDCPALLPRFCGGAEDTDWPQAMVVLRMEGCEKLLVSGLGVDVCDE